MWLLPSISAAAAASWQQRNFLSSRINGIEQNILIKKKKRKERKKEKKKEREKKTSAQGAHDCWPSCLSSLYKILSANLSGMLSELITSSEADWGVEGIVFPAQCSHLLNRVLILKLQISLFGSLQIKTKM